MIGTKFVQKGTGIHVCRGYTGMLISVACFKKYEKNGTMVWTCQIT